MWIKMIPPTPAPVAEFRLGPDSAFTLTHAGEDDEAPAGRVLVEGSRLRFDQRHPRSGI